MCVALVVVVVVVAAVVVVVVMVVMVEDPPAPATKTVNSSNHCASDVTVWYPVKTSQRSRFVPLLAALLSPLESRFCGRCCRHHLCRGWVSPINRAGSAASTLISALVMRKTAGLFTKWIRRKRVLDRFTPGGCLIWDQSGREKIEQTMFAEEIYPNPKAGIRILKRQEQLMAKADLKLLSGSGQFQSRHLFSAFQKKDTSFSGLSSCSSCLVSSSKSSNAGGFLLGSKQSA